MTALHYMTADDVRHSIALSYNQNLRHLSSVTARCIDKEHDGTLTRLFVAVVGEAVKQNRARGMGRDEGFRWLVLK